MDCIMVQRIERDICLLYHQLADYEGIMGDLYWGDVYDLPYWNFLDVPELSDDRKAFVANGCLVMILAMAEEVISGAGDYLIRHITRCRRALDAFEPRNRETHRLLKTVTRTLATIDACKTPADIGNVRQSDVIREWRWVHDTFVRGYYRDWVRKFDKDPTGDTGGE